METEIIGSDVQARLVGLAGPYRDCVYPLRKDEFLIGRSPECDLVIEENTISARHARIVKRGERYELEDLRSTNGTFVEGVRIDIKKLRSEDRLRFDRFEFRFVDPVDVSRTVVAEAPGLASLRKTVLREAEASAPRSSTPPPRPSGEAVRPPGPPETGERAVPPRSDGAAPTPQPPAAPPPPRRPEKGLAPDKEELASADAKGSVLAGWIVAILAAYFLAVIPMIAYSALLGAGRRALGPLVRWSLILHPVRHLHRAWSNVNWGDPAVIVAAVFLLLGIIVGGWILQNARRRSRFASALLFALGYVPLSLLLQAAALDFKLSGMPVSYPWLLSSPNAWGNFALGVAYFFVVTLALSGLGTLLGRRTR
ncbi:MAG: FHA domain-containing protein [Candidatus Aminicenantes bacterium]|nr:FHA domain-containing protein [Candidatus Aminicenantes bacterium]